jgi:hypothetical protein
VIPGQLPGNPRKRTSGHGASSEVVGAAPQ